jgi:hypothetical protein
MSAEEKAVEEAATTARHYLDRILLEPLSEFGLLLKDKVSYWRFKNQVKIVVKARSFLQAKGVQVNRLAGTVLPEAVIPLIEAGSDTSDPMLSDLFAGLLASAVDPSTSRTTHPAYGRVLSQLSPLDARILRDLYYSVLARQRNAEAGKALEEVNANVPLHRRLGLEVTTVARALKSPAEEVSISFENIRRLGICDEGQDFLARANKAPRISLTDFGVSFMRACTQNITST